MSQHLFAPAMSVAALIIIAAMVGCGEKCTPSQVPSSVETARAADAKNTESRSRDSNQQSIDANERHLTAAGKVFDVMMTEVGPNTRRFAVRLFPDSTHEEQEAFSRKMLGVFRSKEFRRDCCAVLMETFSAEECERLVEIYSDPVLKKYQQRKVEYLAQMLSIAEKYTEKAFADDSSVK
jgi:hypothetical protein